MVFKDIANWSKSDAMNSEVWKMNVGWPDMHLWQPRHSKSKSHALSILSTKNFDKWLKWCSAVEWLSWHSANQPALLLWCDISCWHRAETGQRQWFGFGTQHMVHNVGPMKFDTSPWNHRQDEDDWQVVLDRMHGVNTTTIDLSRGGHLSAGSGLGLEQMSGRTCVSAVCFAPCKGCIVVLGMQWDPASTSTTMDHLRFKFRRCFIAPAPMTLWGKSLET